MNQDTPSRERLRRALGAVVAVVLTLVLISVVLLELFAYSWVANSASLWAIAPPVTLLALVVALRALPPWRRIVAIIALTFYALGLFFYGWDEAMERYQSGRLFLLVVFEMALVVLLAIPCLMPRRIRMNP